MSARMQLILPRYLKKAFERLADLRGTSTGEQIKDAMKMYLNDQPERDELIVHDRGDKEGVYEGDDDIAMGDEAGIVNYD